MSLFVTARRILQLQTLTILIVSSVALLFWGDGQAKSALLGGLIGFLPTAYFAAKIGQIDPRRTAKDVVRAFYWGESVKLILTAALFTLVFQLPGVLFLPLFAGFISVIMVCWFACLWPN